MWPKSLLKLAVIVFAALSPFARPAGAGDFGKNPPPAIADVPPPEGWLFEYRPYLWTASLKGDVGIGGMVNSVDIGFDDILDNLDFAWANTLDIRHTNSRWGAFLDFSYIKMSPGIDATPGPIFSTVGIDVEMTLFDAVLTYRLFEWDRGFLDLMAGARYTGLDMGFRFDKNPAGITQTSETISESIVDTVANKVRDAVSRQTSFIRSQVQTALPQLVSAVEARSGNLVPERVAAAQEQILQNVGGVVPPNFGGGVESGAMEQRLREFTRAALAEKVAQTQARISGVRSTALKKAQDARKKAEKRLARELEKRINDRLPEEITGSKNWWDPHVGVRAKHYLNEKLYLGGLVDVGGFGVGSDLALQAGAGIGYHVSDNFALEVIYRYLKTDYNDGGFIYDTEMTGIFLGGVIHFGSGRN